MPEKPRSLKKAIGFNLIRSAFFLAPCCRPASVSPLGNRSTSVSDTAGRVIAGINPLPTLFSNTQQNLRIDARSNRTTYAYNSVGQLTSRKYPEGTRATFSYDTVRNRTLMADGTGRYTTSYDAVGQTMVTASPNNQRQTFSYDAVGQKRSIDATGSGRFTSVFDATSQLSSLYNPNNERITFSYDDTGCRTVQRNAK